MSVAEQSPGGGVLPSFEEELEAVQRRTLKVGAQLAAVLILLFGALDAWVAGGAWPKLMAVRTAAALVLLASGAAASRSALRPLPAAMIILLAVCGPIEAGAFATGMGNSPYLYSMLIPLGAASILVPFGPRAVAALHAEVLLTALGPLALHGGRAALLPALVPGSFMLALSVVSVIGARLHEDLRRREHRSRVEAARQVQLANLGKLAGGLAHELANPLAAVSLELELLDRSRRMPAPRSLERLRHGVDRMREILTAMRQGARVADGQLQPTDLPRQVELALTLLQPQLRAVEVIRDLQPIPTAPAQPTLVGQVLVNLLLNAAHAVRERPEPRIWVRTAVREGAAVIEVEDSGPGVPQDLRERIFEPLFSTKGEEGNGLGLWVSGEIARFHRGSLTVHDGASGGALFRLQLPLELPPAPPAG